MTFSHPILNFLAPPTVRQQQFKFRILQKCENYVAYARKYSEAVNLNVIFCAFLI